MTLLKQKRIYLDYAAATPVLPEVRREMEKYFSREFYNPNAIYEEGVKVRKDVDMYRMKIARILGVAKETIYFTSGGTEANNWAVRGVKPVGRIIVGDGSHPSVSEAASGMKGRIVTLVSSVEANNILGRQIRKERKKSKSEFPLLHIDASQTAAYFNVGLESLACDLLTLDSAKLYGPKGIGALVVRRGIGFEVPPQGTPAVPLIAGFAKALEISARDRQRESERLHNLSIQFMEYIQKVLPEAMVSIDEPNIVNVSVLPILPELIVLALDQEGILVSAGPACNSNKPEPEDTPVRISFGRFTTEQEVKKAAQIFCHIARNMIK